MEAGAILALLGTLVGVYCIGGVIIVSMVVPLQYYFGYKIIKNKIKNAPNVTERWSIIQVKPAGCHCCSAPVLLAPIAFQLCA